MNAFNLALSVVLLSPGVLLPQRAADNRVIETVSVLDFPGVDPSGKTDSQAGIQKAIDYALRTGKILVIPGGTYLANRAVGGVILNILSDLDSAVDVPMQGGLTIHGAGPGKTILKTNTPSADLMAAVSTGQTHYPIYDIEGILLQGPDLYRGTAICPFRMRNGGSGNGLRITGTNSSRVTINNVIVQNFCGVGKTALWLEQAEEFHLSGVSLRYSDTGLKLSGDTNAGRADAITLDSNFSYGADIEATTGVSVNGLLVQGNCQVGLFLDRVDALTVTSAYVEHNAYCPGSGHHAILARRMMDSNFTSLSLTTSTDDIYLDGTAAISSRNQIAVGAPNAFQAGARITLAGHRATGNTWYNVLPEWFATPPLATETLINPVPAYKGGQSLILTPTLQTRELVLHSGPFSELSRCGSSGAPEGSNAAINNSSTSTLGATVHGGGSKHVNAYCDGKNWIVAAAAQ